MTTYPNGRWPANALAAIPGGTKVAPGTDALIARPLLDSVVALQAACKHQTGRILRPTSPVDAYRPIEVSERIYFQRYVTYNTGTGDARKYQGVWRWRLPGTASAAVPGTSIHGNAAAIDWADVDGELYAWLWNNARKFGWVNPPWAYDDIASNGSKEPWHHEGHAVPVSNYLSVPGASSVTLPNLMVGPALLTPVEEIMSETRAVVKVEQGGQHYLFDLDEWTYQLLDPDRARLVASMLDVEIKSWNAEEVTVTLDTVAAMRKINSAPPTWGQ